MKLFLKIATLILFVLAVFVVVIRLLGYTPYNIETVSMQPQYPPSTLVFVHKTDFENLKVDDVITYINSNNSFVTHRIVSINTNEKSVKTKGDSNDFEDIMPVYEENIIGKVCFKVPLLGVVSTIAEKISVSAQQHLKNNP